MCDEAKNGIQLWYLPFGKDAEKPEFRECAKHPHIEEKGYALFHDGEYITNEQMNDKKFLKLVKGEDHGLSDHSN